VTRRRRGDDGNEQDEEDRDEIALPALLAIAAESLRSKPRTLALIILPTESVVVLHGFLSGPRIAQASSG
jgi:hypothetical protein